jgi:hypothetical protein
MGYRGADLDLRTSRTGSATSTDFMSGFEGGDEIGTAQHHNGAPIWVDDTLLACANHAYDIAVAHHATEVRLEHLLHALTRVDAAIPELEARGIRVVPLRRDSAVFLATEIPAGTDEAAAPHRSPELEDVLRLAAANASQAGRSAGVGDVLSVLVDLRGDIPGSALLLRHVAPSAREPWNSLGSVRQHRYPGEPHASALQLSSAAEQDRYAPPAPRSLRRSPDARQPEFRFGEARSPEPRRPSELTLMQGVLDRLGEIERAMSDRLEALEAAFASTAPASDRLETVSRRVEAIAAAQQAALASEKAGTGMEAVAAALGERLSELERSLSEERAQRLQSLAEISTDVKVLVGALGCATEEGSNQPSLTERMQLLITDLEQHRVELGSSVGDRIADLERKLEAQTARATEIHIAYGEELAEVHEALSKLNVNHQQLAGSMEQWRSNDAAEIHLINGRIGAVQEDGAKRLEMLERIFNEIDALSQLSVEGGEPETREPTPPALPAAAVSAGESAGAPQTAVAKLPERSPGPGPRPRLKPLQRFILPHIRRRRDLDFRRWLFGTDDWIRESWRKRTARNTPKT